MVDFSNSFLVYSGCCSNVGGPVCGVPGTDHADGQCGNARRHGALVQDVLHLLGHVLSLCLHRLYDASSQEKINSLIYSFSWRTFSSSWKHFLGSSYTFYLSFLFLLLFVLFPMGFFLSKIFFFCPLI